MSIDRELVSKSNKMLPSFLAHIIHHVRAHQSDGDTSSRGDELPSKGERTFPAPTSARSLLSKKRRTEPSLRKKSKYLNNLSRVHLVTYLERGKDITSSYSKEQGEAQTQTQQLPHRKWISSRHVIVKTWRRAYPHSRHKQDEEGEAIKPLWTLTNRSRWCRLALDPDERIEALTHIEQKLWVIREHGRNQQSAYEWWTPSKARVQYHSGVEGRSLNATTFADRYITLFHFPAYCGDLCLSQFLRWLLARHRPPVSRICYQRWLFLTPHLTPTHIKEQYSLTNNDYYILQPLSLYLFFKRESTPSVFPFLVLRWGDHDDDDMKLLTDEKNDEDLSSQLRQLHQRRREI